jgi:hypothetical protein
LSYYNRCPNPLSRPSSRKAAEVKVVLSPFPKLGKEARGVQKGLRGGVRELVQAIVDGPSSVVDGRFSHAL